MTVAEGTLLDLADVRLAALLAERDEHAASQLEAVVRRLFDPADPGRLTVSAFSSSL